MPARRRRPGVAVLVLVLAGALLALPAPPAGAEPPGTHVPPVDRPLLDRFRPPSTPYGPGNRGVDYGTRPGDEVRASATGEVTFAGRIGPAHHVVVLHPDGLRTSYSFLAGVAVRRGDPVAQGDVVGVAAAGFHFGARAGDRYLDPLELFGGAGAPEVRLVPDELRSPASPGEERAGLAAQLLATGAGLLRGGGAAVRWAADRHGDAAAIGRRATRAAARWTWRQVEAELEDRLVQARALAELASTRGPDPRHLLEVLAQARRYLAAQEGCTPASEPVPPRPAGRRIAVLVGGLGSAGGDAAVLDLDTAALGYGPADVAQFSYAGGRVPGVGALAGVPTADYGPDATGQDLDEAGARLRALLADVRAAHPGVPVDVVAHSMGGLVARGALAGGAAPVDTLVTLGAPHDGADLATAAALLGTTDVGRGALDLGTWLSGGSLDASTPSVAQLSESSTHLEALARRDLPDGTRVTSVAAAGDLVVPALHSSLDGATNVLVPLRGPGAHSSLPGSPAARREVALALAGAGPTCRDLGGLGSGLVEAFAVSWLEDGVGAAAGTGAIHLDRLLPGDLPLPAPRRRPTGGAGAGG